VASNYEVNVKLNTRTVNKQLNNLEKRISKLNKLAQGGRANREVNKRDKEKLVTATKVTRQETKTLRIKQQQLKVDQQQLKVEQQTANAIRQQSVSRPGRRGGATTSRGTNVARGNNQGVLSGALISGAFPLLFGQGLVGGAAGFAGGAIGGAIGGQMGGFAGGLVATAGLTMITNLRDGMVDLGNALSPANANIDQSIEKLKIISGARAKEIKMIEEFQGKQAALAEVTKDTAKVIGVEGVNALRQFAEIMKMLSDGVATTFLKIQAGLADIVNKVFNFAGGDLGLAKSQLGDDNPLVQALARNREAEANLDRNVMVNGFETNYLLTEAGRAEAKRLEIEKKVLENQIKVRAEKEAGLRIDKEIGAEHAKLKAGINAQFEGENRILELRRSGLNPALAKQVALFEASARNVKTGLTNELNTVEQLLEKEKASSQTYTDKIMLLEIRKQSLEEQIETNDALLEQDKERLVQATRLAMAAKATQDSFDALKQTIATDLADGIQGLVRGTTTLSSVLNNVLDKMIDAAFNMAFFGNAGGSLISGSGLFGSILGAFGGNKTTDTPILPTPIMVAANGGRIPGGRPSLVGEKGPELFTPATGGYVTPNHALGGSTNIVVNVDASGTEVQGNEEQGRELGRLISAAVQSELIQQKRPGGILA
jgi:hypothetical protein